MKEIPIFFNGPMVRAILDGRKATARLQRRAAKAHRKVADLMRRLTRGLKKTFSFKPTRSRADEERRMEDARRWNLLCMKYYQAGLDSEECRLRTNAELGLPADYSPGRFV